MALSVWPLSIRSGWMKRRRKISRRTRAAASGFLCGSCLVVGFAASEGASNWLILFPPSLLLPWILLAVGLSWKTRRSGLALTLFALALLLGPIMGFHVSKQAPRSASGLRLRVVSLNAASWDVDLVNLGRRTAELRPNILILQEMWWLKHLKSFRIGLPGMLFRGDGTGKRGVVVGSEYPISEVPLPPPDRTVGHIVDVSGQRVLVLSVHGKKSSSGYANPVASSALQEKQAQEIVDYIQAVGLPVILGGDFNGTPQAPLGNVLSRHLEDAFSQAGMGYGYTFPSRCPLVRLDRVMLTPGLAEVESFSLVDVGSDHLALVVDLRLESSRDSGNNSVQIPTGPAYRSEPSELWRINW